MPDFSGNCPTSEQLKRLLDGSIDAAVLEEIQSHVDHCDSCQLALERMTAGTSSWDEVAQSLRQGKSSDLKEPHSDGPLLADAIEQMKAVDLESTLPREELLPRSLLVPSDHPGAIGRIGRYEVLEVIGQGGMGIVLRAFDPTLHRIVAVKVLAPYLAHNAQARKRFIREAQAVAAVCHDHVITIHGIEDSVEQPLLVMQFIHGRSLQQKIDQTGSLEVKEILRIGMQTASGLAAAHSQGLVHRDVKPSNILLENGVERVKLTDFGLARAADDASLTQSGVIAGTPQYMAPEQANGDVVDHRADLFSLGSVMYAMCTGHSPFRASTTMGVLKRVVHDSPRQVRDINPDIPGWLDEIIGTLLEKNPANRFQTAREVAEVLAAWLAHLQASSQRPPSDLQYSAKQKPKVETESEAITKPAAKMTESTESFAFWMLPTSRPSWLPESIAWPLSPRVIALLVALISIVILRAAPLEGLIIFGVIWCIASLINWWKTIPPDDRTSWWKAGPQAMAASFAQEVRAKSATAASKMKSMYSGVVSENPAAPTLVVQATDETASDKALWARQRTVSLSLLLFVVSLLDLSFGAMALLNSRSVLGTSSGPISILLGLLSILAGVHSFILSASLYVRENYELVRRSCLLGLLPLSPMMIVRIPLSLWLLFWLERTEVKSSFSNTAFRETLLGRIDSRLRVLLDRFSPLRILGSIIWMFGWALFVLVIVLLPFMFFYLIPGGPAEYHFQDLTALQVRSRESPGNYFTIKAIGHGKSLGIVNPPEIPVVTVVQIDSSSPSRPLISYTVTLEGRQNVIGSDGFKADLDRTACRKILGLSMTSDAPSSPASEDLMKALMSLSTNASASVPMSTRTPITEDLFSKLYRRGNALMRLLSHGANDWSDAAASLNYVAFADRLDGKLFEVTSRSGFRYEAKFPDTVVAFTVLVTIALLAAGTLLIVYRRHF